MRKCLLLSTFLLLSILLKAQLDSIKTIDIGIFSDASNHWYGIADKDAVIQPRPGHPRYPATNMRAIADNIILFQKDNGGWPKNYDMQAILTPDQADSVKQSKFVLNTTFDNRTTYSQISYLSKVYSFFHGEKYKAAALKGLQFILDAQYTNGGWPQYYPLEKNYSRCITYNDDAMGGIMWLLKDIDEHQPDYNYIDEPLRKKLVAAYLKGLNCIIKTQINDAGAPTAWCQQYDEVSLQPAWARKFEPPGICNSESVGLVLLLMSIKDPSLEVINAVKSAAKWFNDSKILYTKVETFAAPEMITPYKISRTDRRVITDSAAPPIWTRYYELQTHRPLFCNRDSKVVYSLAEVARERRDGYAWYTYEPQKVLKAYPQWLERIQARNKVY
ncbi:MAG: pectate lyase [Bacteroidetes bacterium]|nr:pectate lyase [Bacteroidota bacterium]